MSDSLYTRLLTLRSDKGPVGTVRCLAFSPSGAHLASGGDDNLLIVWELACGGPVCILQTDSPIISLVWDSCDNGKLFIGDEKGSVVLLDVSVPSAETRSDMKGHAVITSVTAPVYAMAFCPKTRHLAMGLGGEVHISKAVDGNKYATFSILPPPDPLPNWDPTADSRVRIRSVHFTGGGRRLLVAYLNHGVICWDLESSTILSRIRPSHFPSRIGSTALAIDGRSILLSNLSTGMDLYPIGQSKPIMHYSSTISAEQNYPVAVNFAQGNKLVFCGGSEGAVNIWETASGIHQQTLDHEGNLILVTSGYDGHGYSYIATGAANLGDKTCITVWRSRFDQKWSERIMDALARASRWVVDIGNPRSITLRRLVLWFASTILVVLCALPLLPRDNPFRQTVIGVACRTFETFETIILVATSFILTQWTKFKMIIRASLLEFLQEETSEVA